MRKTAIHDEQRPEELDFHPYAHGLAGLLSGAPDMRLEGCDYFSRDTKRDVAATVLQGAGANVEDPGPPSNDETVF